MQSDPMTRRRFLLNGSVGVAALTSSRALGSNDRLSIGIIGTGNRGSAHLSRIGALAEAHNAEITAICDVWQVNLGKAAQKAESQFGRPPRRFTRYQELLALRDVDAVVIATPDFAHTPIMIEALKADKDVYVEKPMSLEIEAANKALDLARARKRIVQVGTQYRSHGGYRAAAKELAGGVLGQIVRISAEANFNAPRWARDFSDCKAKDVDWDAYLFKRPMRRFDPRALRCWHLYREFTNGLAGLWMSHYVDAVHLLTGSQYPSSAVAHGGTYVWKDGREHTDTFHALLEYPEGFLFDWGMCLANSAAANFAVYGTAGTLELGTEYMNPNSLKLSDTGGRKKGGVKERRITPEPNIDHMGDWLECLRSRRRPIADIQYGHQHAVATIMAAAALEAGRCQRYNPKARRLIA